MFDMKKDKASKLFVLTIFVVVFAMIGLVIFLVWKGLPSPSDNVEVSEETKVSSGDMDAETQKLIDEVKSAANKTVEDSGEQQVIGQLVTFTKDDEVAGGDSVEQAVVVAPNSNPVSTDTGKVLTHDGRNEATNVGYAGSPDAPLQSDPIKDTSKLPSSVIRVLIKPDAMEPKRIEVVAGQAVALAVTADSSVEIFKFDDPLLSAVAIGLKPGETREITFNAPSKPGNYVFFSDYIGHRSSGAEGLMVVK